MFSIKTRARYLTHGVKTKAMLFSLLPLTALLGCAVSLLTGALCAAYGTGAVFAGSPAEELLRGRIAAKAAPWICFIAAMLFFIWFRALRFTLRAVYYHHADANQLPPHSFISFRTGLRTLYCDLQLGLRKSGWFALFLLPAGITALSLWLVLRRRGLSFPLLIAGAALTGIQLLCGAGTAFFVNRRYCLTRYLMYLNPLIGVRDAITSGVLLTRGSRGLAAVCRLCALPWQALRVFAPARPFGSAYAALLDTVLCETVFAEDKTKVRAPAVTFYIGKKTKISELK